MSVDFLCCLQRSGRPALSFAERSYPSENLTHRAFPARIVAGYANLFPALDLHDFAPVNHHLDRSVFDAPNGPQNLVPGFRGQPVVSSILDLPCRVRGRANRGWTKRQAVRGSRARDFAGHWAHRIRIGRGGDSRGQSRANRVQGKDSRSPRRYGPEKRDASNSLTGSSVRQNSTQADQTAGGSKENLPTSATDRITGELSSFIRGSS